MSNPPFEHHGISPLSPFSAAFQPAARREILPAPMKRLLLAACSLAFGLTSPAAETTRIYLANDDHTDYVWTADADTYAKLFVEMLDWHLKLADETAGNPSPYRNRFNADGSLWLATYEQRKSPAEFARLIARIKDGTISVPLNTVVSCYGGQPAEEGIDRGIIARLWNVSDTASTPALTFHPGLAAARRTTHIETDLDALPLAAGGEVRGALACQQIATFRLLPK